MGDERNKNQEMSYEDVNMVKESVPYYVGKKPGEYTLEDYYALPDDQRVELIDGVFYDMAAPTLLHQFIIGEIYQGLRSYIDKKGGLCMPFMAPVDVQLDCDDRTMVQPDVLMICDLNKMKFTKIYGAPEFVVEVLSASTKKKDMNLKLSKYMDAGVKEYWVVDPEKLTVLVFNFENEEFTHVYGFDSTIPVGLFYGECKIDFNKIYERAKVFYEQMEADE